MNAVWVWLSRFSLVFGIISIVIGLFFTLTHHDSNNTIKLLNFFLISAVNIEIIVFTIMYIFLFSGNTQGWIGWVIFSSSIIISLPFCYLSMKYIRFGAAQIGILAGFFIALIA